MKSRLLLTIVAMSLFPQGGSARTSPVTERPAAAKPGELPGFEVYSYNDRNGRYEGVFTATRLDK